MAVMLQEDSILRFVTWNTDGIKNTQKSPRKFEDVKQHLIETKTDVAFINETHVGPESSSILKNVEGWKSYFTVYSSTSKGVAILIHDRVPFEYIYHDEDSTGRYIVLICRLYDELFTLVNVYNHKVDRKVLGELKDYLTETAEGTLVVGGDFNTVLHPTFDRRPSSAKHSPFRGILEEFTASLNLRDTWSYFYSTDEIHTIQKFTRYDIYQNSYSRIDMFLMHVDTMIRASECKIQPNNISDHAPLFLDLKVMQLTENTIPHVALQGYTHMARIEPEKISRAEILSAINTVSTSELKRPLGFDVGLYKKHRFTKSEALKKDFNLMLQSEWIPEDFKSHYVHGHFYIFSVDYLIFSQIFAKRISLFITPSIKGETKTEPLFCTVYISREPQVIRWSFLQEIISKLRVLPTDPPLNTDIVDFLLPKVQTSSEDLRHLHFGCPLTNTILNLALQELKDQIEKIKCSTSVCYHRQALGIHADESRVHVLTEIVQQFRRQSCITLSAKSD